MKNWVNFFKTYLNRFVRNFDKNHALVLIYSLLMTGCFASLKEKQTVNNSSSTDATVENNYPPPSAVIRLSPLSIRENIVNLRVSGVANGDQVSLFTDSNCTQQIATGTLQTNNTYIQLTTNRLNNQTYSIYAQRQKSGTVSNCSAQLLNLVVDTNLDTAITASLNSTTSTSINKVLDLTQLVNGDVLKFYADSSCTELIGTKTLTGSNTPTSTFSINSDSYRKYGTYTVYGTKSYTKNSITTTGSCLSTQVSLTFVLAAPTSATFTTTPNIHDQSIQVSIGGGLGGDLLEVYTDSQCTQKVGQGTIASGQTSASITTDNLSAGMNQIFAKRSSTFNSVTTSSTCSISSLISHTYVPMSAPVISSKTVNSPTQITLNLSNLTVGDTILIFPANDCTYATVASIAAFTASAATESVIIDSDITRVYGNITFSTQSIYGSLSSSCTQSTTSHQFNLSAPTEITLNSGTTNYEKLLPVNVKYGLSGDTMKVYTNNTCTDLIGEGTVGSNLIASFTTSTAINVGTVHLYAKRFYSTTESTCSGDLYQYNYQNLPASTYSSINKTTGVSFNLSFSDYKNANEVYVYTDVNCTTELDHKTVNGTSPLHFVVNLTDGNYPLYYKSKYNQIGGSSIYSTCTDAGITYVQNGYLSTSFVYKINLNNTTAYNLTLPLKFKGSTNVYVHWGDKSVDIIQGTFDGYSNLPSHTYSVKQIYEIEISGQFDGIELNEGYYFSQYLVDVLRWGTNQFKSTEKMFYAQTAISSLSATDVPDFSLNTTMESMFSNCINFNSNLNTWDTSHVTKMKGLFQNASKFNQPLNSWNTASVIDLSYMFSGATIFNQDITTWNTSNVTDMTAMFYYAQNFNQAIGSWNTGSLVNIQSMFYTAYAFNQPLNNWDTSHITNMYNVFGSAYSFNQPLNNWDTSQVTNMSSMFDNAAAFNQPLNNWDTGKVINMDSMFKNTNSFNSNISTWNTASVTSMNSMFAYSQYFNQNISSWNTSKVLDTGMMFYTAYSFNQPLNNWDVSKVTNFGHMFANATNFNQPLNNWNTISATNMKYMFSSATNFNQDIGSWNTANVNYMTGMFYSAYAFNQPLNNWNTSHVIEMSSMFREAHTFNQSLSQWNTTNVNAMSEMFYGATNFNQNLTSWDVYGHVNYCSSFKFNSSLQSNYLPAFSCNSN